MKKKFTQFFLLLFTLIVFSNVLKAQNLLYNGDFEYGGSGNGFISDDPSYFYLTNPNGISFAGNWAIVNNPQAVNTNFISGTDHSGTGNMMVVDATTNGGAKRFWKAGNNGNGIIGFITGTSYTFSYWIKSVSNDPSRANIGISFNNVSNVVLASGNATAPLASDGWQQVKYTFTANGNTVNIELYDNNTDAIGNDFAIDDIELYGPPQPFSFSYSSVNPTCSNVADGSIVAYGTEGTAPYLYSFDGGAFTSTNVLNGLTTSNHTITVQDAALNTLTSPVIHIISPTDVLNATTNKDSICSGHSAILNATGGGNNGYTWVATPADPTLSVNATSPVVSPLVPTIYVVSTSSTYATNLVFNGDFELGNNGFSTDYVFKTSNTSGAQRTYGITDSASKFYSAFSNCGDHTTGSGKMFVCDGSTNPTNRIWSQTVPVKPGSTYTFTYWIQSVTSPSPAQIETRINNVVLPAGTNANPYTAPATNTCNNWQKVSYSWTAGVGVTSADLSIYDKNFVDIGNDFALDDISFITLTTTCTLVDSVKVFVTTTTSSITDFSYTPNAICVGSSTNPTLNTVPSFTTGGTYTATPAGLKIDSLTGAIDVANSLPNTYNVTYFAPIVGCRLSGSSSTTITIRPLVATPTASVTVQPTCTTPTGTIVVSNPLATNYYFSVDSGLNYQSSATFTGLAPNSTHYIVVKDTNVGGCISDTISLTINPVTPPPSTPTGSVSFQPTCAVATGTIIVSSPHSTNYVYSINGTTYQADTTFAGLTANTIYPVIVKDVTTGCISSALNLTIDPFIPVIATTNTQTFSSCKDIIYNSITYSSSTILKDTIKSFQGCDSIYNIVNININPITTTTNTQTFSSCKDIIYNSITYSSSTILKDTVKSFQGCDSVYNVVNININPITPATNTQTLSSCKDIIYNSISHSSSTILKDTIKSFQGCDSIYNIINININPITTTTNTQTFSSCKDIVYNGMAYSSSTILKDTVKSFQGCDSIYNIINININPITTTTNTQTFSSCKDIVYNSITYSASTVLKDTVKSFQSCDSIYNIVNININPITPTTNTQTLSSCKDIIYNSISYSSSTILKDTVKSFQGCDSIYNIVNININPITITTNNTNLSGCGSVIYKGNTYTSSIILKDTVKSFQGCDSIYNIANITVFTVPNTPIASVTAQPTCLTPTGTIVITAPNGANYQYSIGGVYQTSSTFVSLAPNSYSITVKDISSGCISSAISLTVSPVPPAPSATINYNGNPFFNQGTAPVTVSTTATITSGTYTATPSGLSINSSTGTIDLTNSTVNTYTITYTFNSGACSNTATTKVTINQLKTDIYIPNSFTPNGDGKNDTWNVYGNTIKSVNITVYNQWGERIFSSSNQSKGWDGLGFGKTQPAGIYVYIAQIVLLDGTVMNRKGSVNLIR